MYIKCIKKKTEVVQELSKLHPPPPKNQEKKASSPHC